METVVLRHIKDMRIFSVFCWVTEQPLLTPDTEYDPKADIRFWKAGKASLLDLHAGELVILLPGEAHKPCVRSGDVGKVKKAVFKIAL